MEKEIEIWKPIKGYEGFEVSSFGNVRNLDRLIKYSNNTTHLHKGHSLVKNDLRGYKRVTLSKNNTTKTVQIHRLVAEAFIPNPKNLPQVNHKDECKDNNHVSNLEWCDAKYNSNYGSRRIRTSSTYKETGRCVKVIKLSLDGDILKEYESLSDTEKDGFNKKNVFQCCKFERLSSNGYLWLFAKDKHRINDVVEEYKKRKRKSPCSSPVCVYNKKGTLLYSFKSISDAKKNLHIGDKVIRECCQGVRDSYKNFIIKYSE